MTTWYIALVIKNLSIDPCSVHQCHNGASCVNENGVAVCVCTQGYSGNKCQYTGKNRD